MTGGGLWAYAACPAAPSGLSYDLFGAAKLG
jgi:hypothetical protein